MNREIANLFTSKESASAFLKNKKADSIKKTPTDNSPVRYMARFTLLSVMYSRDQYISDSPPALQ